MTDRLCRLEVTTLSGATCLRASGEIDISTVSNLAGTLEAVIRESRGACVVDLCDVDFLDSSGVSVLVRARALLGRDDRDLVLVCPPGPARRLLDVVGISDLFTLPSSRAEAADSLRPG
jgi:anti-sigma B factor antagonist